MRPINYSAINNFSTCHRSLLPATIDIQSQQHINIYVIETNNTYIYQEGFENSKKPQTITIMTSFGYFFVIRQK